MAIVYELWIECLDSAGAIAMASHFEDVDCQPSSGRTFALEKRVSRDLSGNFTNYYGIYTHGLSRGELQDYVDASDVAVDLLKRLHTAPAFVFAAVGYDRSYWDHEDHLFDYRDEGSFSVDEGMVLSESFWKELGEPKYLKPFRPGYLWRPYLGERISILQISEYRHLYEKTRSLPGYHHSD